MGKDRIQRKIGAVKGEFLSVLTRSVVVVKVYLQLPKQLLAPYSVRFAHYVPPNVELVKPQVKPKTPDVTQSLQFSTS